MSAEADQHRGGSGFPVPRPDPPRPGWLVAARPWRPQPTEPHADAARSATCPPLSAVPSLLSLLKDADPNVRLRTARAAGDLAREIRRVLPALRTALEEAALCDGDDGVRSKRLQALLRAGPQPTTEVAAAGGCASQRA